MIDALARVEAELLAPGGKVLKHVLAGASASAFIEEERDP
jgi:hypothetical protein